eukprot:1160714-Pelagomonas_calceolata.AAC.10
MGTSAKKLMDVMSTLRVREMCPAAARSAFSHIQCLMCGPSGGGLPGQHSSRQTRGVQNGAKRLQKGAFCVDKVVVGFLDNMPQFKPKLCKRVQRKACAIRVASAFQLSICNDVYRSCVRAIPDESTLERFCAAGGVLSPELYRDFTYARTPSSDANVSPFLPYALAWQKP